MPYLCPQGHSGSANRCEVCGASLELASAAQTQVMAPLDEVDLSPTVESSAVDASTAELTAAGLDGGVSWVLEMIVDPAWYEGQQTTHQMPTQTPPVVIALREATCLIGRRSTTRGIDPEIDCSADPGVSRRHAQLCFSGGRWSVEDLNSSNGTFLASSDLLPEQPLEPGAAVPVSPGARIYVGAWTRLVLRPARESERH